MVYKLEIILIHLFHVCHHTNKNPILNY